MPYHDLETQALEKIENKYLLTILISKRVNQLKQGVRPLIEEVNGLTPYDIALREVVDGKVTPEHSQPPKSSPTTPTET